jgi:hypothetical protein
MKTVKINTKEICKLPESWKELTAGQVKALCRLFLVCRDPHMLKVKLFEVISGMRLIQRYPRIMNEEPCYWFYSKQTRVVALGLSQIKFLTKNFDWMFKQSGERSVVESEIYINHFPELRNRFFRRLYGPDSALYNFRWEEFIRAEVAYRNMQKKGGEKEIEKLYAVLYRPAAKGLKKDSPEFKGDMRQPFDDHHLKAMARHTDRLSPWMKVYIRMFYDGCRSFIIRTYPDAFGGGSGESSSTLKSFMQLSAALAGQDPTKSQKLRETLLWDVLPVLDSMGKEAKEFKERKGHG